MEEIGHKIYHKTKVSRLAWRDEWLVKDGSGNILFEGTARECGDYLSSKRREAAVNGTEFETEGYENE